MTIIAPSRRGFLAGMLAFAAAPAIVRASSLMPVRSEISPGAVTQEALLYKPPTVIYVPPGQFERIRALLMPGLQEIFCMYDDLPAAWESAFR